MIEFRKTTEFEKSYKRLERKFPSLKDDFRKLAASLLGNPNQGVLMADKNDMESISIKELRNIWESEKERLKGQKARP